MYVARDVKTSQTTTDIAASQTYLDSQAVVSAVTKLENQAKSLKYQLSQQKVSTGVCAAFLTIFLVLLILFIVACAIRYFNRVRKFQGEEPLVGTDWLMFPMGPSSDNSTRKKMQQVNIDTLPNNGKIINPYKSSSIPSTNTFPTINSDKLYSTEHHSMISNDTMVDNKVQTETILSKIKTIDSKSSGINSNDSPNVNRYTIDIEYNPNKNEIEHSRQLDFQHAPQNDFQHDPQIEVEIETPHQGGFKSQQTDFDSYGNNFEDVDLSKLEKPLSLPPKTHRKPEERYCEFQQSNGVFLAVGQSYRRSTTSSYYPPTNRGY